MARGSSAGLRVLGRPEVLSPHSFPGQQILTFDIANHGDEDAEFDASDLVLIGEDGAVLAAVIAFDRESGGPGTKIEAKRAALAPGTTLRVVAVWREGDVARLDYPGGTVELSGGAATNGPPA